MKKLLIPLSLSLLFVAATFSGNDFQIVHASENPYVYCFEYEEKSNGNYIVKNVEYGNLADDDLRIYGNVDGHVVDEIDINCFNDVHYLSSLMISNNIEIIPQGTLDIVTLTEIRFTGGLDEWADIGYTTNLPVYEYSFDEGFINYWNKFIRPEADTSICDVSNEQYTELLNLYNNLSAFDKSVVDSYVDKGNESIGDSMKYLKAFFAPEEPKKNTAEIDKKTTLSIIVGIAVFGMTSIAVFYLLMKKNIIS